MPGGGFCAYSMIQTHARLLGWVRGERETEREREIEMRTDTGRYMQIEGGTWEGVTRNVRTHGLFDFRSHCWPESSVRCPVSGVQRAVSFSGGQLFAMPPKQSETERGQWMKYAEFIEYAAGSKGMELDEAKQQWAAMVSCHYSVVPKSLASNGGLRVWVIMPDVQEVVCES